MFPTPDESPDNFLSQLRSRSPAALLAGTLTGLIVLALAINLLSGAIYDLLSLTFASGGEGSHTARMRLDVALGVVAVAILVLCVVYLRKLSDELAPQVQRVVTLALPFVRKQGHIEFRPIESLAAHKGMDQLLNWPVSKGEAKAAGLEWDSQWTWPPAGSGSPFRGAAVTYIYDLVEWMAIREIADYGEHLFAGQGKQRPGDDLIDALLPMERTMRDALFQGVRPNYIWQYGNWMAEQKLKLPEQTTITLREQARTHGVETYGGEPVRELAIINPGGVLTVTPSQIWRRATRPQFVRVVEKQTGAAEEVYPVEMRIAVTVKLKQKPYIWPWAGNSLAYQRWLLELQAQMVRHMDMDRFVEYEYRRMIVDIRDAVAGDSGA